MKDLREEMQEIINRGLSEEEQLIFNMYSKFEHKEGTPVANPVHVVEMVELDGITVKIPQPEISRGV